MGRENLDRQPAEQDTIISIRLLCQEYGIHRSDYFTLANMNQGESRSDRMIDDETPRPMSYATFLQVMAGYPTHPYHADALARSRTAVRDALHQQGIKPLRKTIPALCAVVIAAWHDDPDILTKKELTALRRILRTATARIRSSA